MKPLVAEQTLMDDMEIQAFDICYVQDLTVTTETERIKHTNPN